MEANASARDIEAVNNSLVELGFSTHMIKGVKRIVIGAVGDKDHNALLGIEGMPGVENVVPILKPFKLASREAREGGTVIRVKGAVIGGPEMTVVAGPCAIESREQLLAAALCAKGAGATVLRGGAFKPRTSPYSFQGMGEEGLKIMKEVGDIAGLATVTEVIDQESLDMAVKYVDMVQVGARNMQNFRLLQEVGDLQKPVLLKRGMSATIEEWLMAAEYIMSRGNGQVVLCERGIRTFETYTRNTLDLSAIPLVKSISHLPVIADPSHATGNVRLVGPMSRAAMAAGADGLMIEMHPNPLKALCDGKQSLSPGEFEALMEDLRQIMPILRRAV